MPTIAGVESLCPNPAHPDKNPSAWINTDKQAWYCAACGEGGDTYDIAAWHFGFSVPGYKSGKDFIKLREAMATDLGWAIKGDTVYRDSPSVIPPAPPPLPAPPPPLQPPIEPQPVVLLPGMENEEGEAIPYPSLNWQAILPEDSFLDIWMRCTTVDDVTEEYHFWNGMIALAMALGKDVTLWDSRQIFANLFICTLGKTGQGKTKAKYHLDTLVEKALPYDRNDPFSKGVSRFTLASAEALIWAFQKSIEDPANPKRTLGNAPVRGIVEYSELSSLIGRTSRQGNILIPTLMQFYDCERYVQTISRGHGVETATDPFACVFTTSQPPSLRKLLTESDATSGFLNRWLFVSGPPKARVAVGGAMVDVGPAIKPLQDVHGWAGQAGTLDWDDDALDRFTDFFDSHIAPAQAADESYLLNRIDLLMKKLILLFSANMQTQTATLAAVDQAIQCWEYLLRCYGIPKGEIGGTINQDCAEAIKKRLETRPRKKKELYDLIKHKFDAEQIARTLKHLEEFDIIKREVTNQGRVGRPGEVYTLLD